ncbi:MAG: ABC transporter substrate binding protein [Thiohalophilus sp.]|jgi:ABC-type uncharacterized transport system substrate-binding protein
MSCLISSLIFILCTISSQAIAAREQNQPVIILYENNTKAYDTFKETIHQLQQLESQEIAPLIFIDSKEISREKIMTQLRNARAVVTLGNYSAQELASLQIKVSHIHALITKENYQKLMPLNKTNTRNSCALVIDQPLERIISAAKKFIPNLQRIGIIIDPGNTADYDKHIQGSDIIYENLSNDIHSAITQFADKSVDIIVATQNSSIYNNETARNILISSYHYNIPLVGYSESFVRAGAILGVYSTPEMYAIDVYDLIKNPKNCTKNEIRYSSKFITKTNPQVASSLGIRFDN